MSTPSQLLADRLSLTGLDAQLTESEALFLENVHRFARDTLRPAGIELDRAGPEETLRPDSPLWKVFGEFLGLGFSPALLAEMHPVEAARITALAAEELAWGDAGPVRQPRCRRLRPNAWRAISTTAS